MLQSSEKSSVAGGILLVVGAALVTMGIVAISLDSLAKWREIETSASRRGAAALDMLEAIHTQSMLHRTQIEDGDPAIATLDGAMKQFSQSLAGTQLWLVMGPKTIAYQRARGHADIEVPRDSLDRETIATGKTQQAKLAGLLRVSRPIILGQGSAAHVRCAACHAALMGVQDGEVIGAYSAAVELAPAIAFWRSNTYAQIFGGMLLVAIALCTVGVLLRLTVLRPLRHLTTATRQLARGDLDTNVSYAERDDELGTLARSLEVFRTSLLDKLRSEKRIAHMAQHDTLTGLPNRAGLNEYVDRALESCNHEHRLAVISIDLDGLKEINSMHGHCAGDQLLKAFARRLSKIRADGEFVARTGGDEFLAVKQFLDQASLLEFVARLEGCLLAEYDVAGAGLPVGGHIGVALFPEDAESKDELIIKADIAMQRARVSPQQVTCFYEARMDEAARDRWRLTSDLGGVVERNELTLAYQVQKSIKTLKTTGYEALLRWKHPHRGMVSPADFIPLAEACGAIVPIGQWVLRTACAEAARWPRDYRIAVNISPLQLTEELPELVHDVLLQSGLSPQRLELEITELAIIGDKTKALRILQQIKDLGVGIALDDFGTGYSSLDTLRSFPFDKIKLDRSFVSELVESAQARAIIRAVVALGSCLHIPILAEGVETPEQLALLKAEDCDEVQGYLFGRPQAMVDVAHQRRLAS